MINSRRGSSLFAFLAGITLGVLLGVILTHKYLTDRAAKSPGQTPAVERPVAGAAKTGERADDTIARKLREWKLTPDDLKRDLENAGEVIRKKSGEIGDKIADATSDARIITVIKARYTVDDRLSAWNITVGSKDGHVTLTGTVNSQDLIGRAIVLALDTSGVVDVVSTLRVQ